MMWELQGVSSLLTKREEDGIAFFFPKGRFSKSCEIVYHFLEKNGQLIHIRLRDLIYIKLYLSKYLH